MSDLTSRDHRKLEDLLVMGGGYVLNFSDRTFSDFFTEFVGKDIDNVRYRSRGTSKANRLRSFWQQEPNGVVAKCLKELIEHADSFEILTGDQKLIDDYYRIIARLEETLPVADIDAISAYNDDRDFELVAKAARESIEKSQPEQGLDRLHTFVVKLVRTICEERHLPINRDTPLNGLFGAYVKHLRDKDQFGSEMAERILKSSISNLEYFNHVRNNNTLAHDNQVLSYDEALLIFNHVASTVRFVKALEDRLKAEAKSAAATFADDFDIPF